MSAQTSPAGQPLIVRTVAGLREQVGRWRREGLRVGFVPTMGALHEGHLTLVRAALNHADRVVVSIFVNPTQFGPNEDLARYPRDEAGDVAKLATVGAHLVFAPGVEEMYPPGATTWVTVEGLSEGLCADVRPGHFRGVATVVTKLLNQAQADVAAFGEKDYQQLLIVQRLARDLAVPTAILPVPTVREPDGLAMSSRNLYLDVQARRAAPELHATLRDIAGQLETGGLAAPLLRAGIDRLLRAGFTKVDYLELRDARDLTPLDRLGERPARLLTAAHLGAVRLIDNIPVPTAR